MSEQANEAIENENKRNNLRGYYEWPKLFDAPLRIGQSFYYFCRVAYVALILEKYTWLFSRFRFCSLRFLKVDE